MSIKQDLFFVEKLVEMMHNKKAEVVVNKHKFEIWCSISENVGFVHIDTGNHINTNKVTDLTDFLRGHTPYMPTTTNEQLYLLVVEGAMKYALSEEGMSRTTLDVLIGSIAEYRPEENEVIRRLFKGMK